MARRLGRSLEVSLPHPTSFPSHIHSPTPPPNLFGHSGANTGQLVRIKAIRGHANSADAETTQELGTWNFAHVHKVRGAAAPQAPRLTLGGSRPPDPRALG